MTTKQFINLANEWWENNDTSLDITVNVYKSRSATDWSSSMGTPFYSAEQIEYHFGDLTKCNGKIELVTPFGTFRV